MYEKQLRTFFMFFCFVLFCFFCVCVCFCFLFVCFVCLFVCFFFCLSLLKMTEICFGLPFWKFSGKKSGKKTPILLLAPGARNLGYATECWYVTAYLMQDWNTQAGISTQEHRPMCTTTKICGWNTGICVEMCFNIISSLKVGKSLIDILIGYKWYW